MLLFISAISLYRYCLYENTSTLQTSQSDEITFFYTFCLSLLLIPATIYYESQKSIKILNQKDFSTLRPEETRKYLIELINLLEKPKKNKDNMTKIYGLLKLHRVYCYEETCYCNNSKLQ